jgi:hypothetical protein
MRVAASEVIVFGILAPLQFVLLPLALDARQVRAHHGLYTILSAQPLILWALLLLRIRAECERRPSELIDGPPAI